MGNPIKKESPIEELVSKLKTYQNMLESFVDIDNQYKIFKIREISRKIQDLTKDIEALISCEERNDFSITEEEKSLYVQRFILLSMMSNLI